MPAQSSLEAKEQPQWIECNVLGVFVHPTRNTPIVFIGNEDESAVIPVWIGFLEAQAILFAWKHLDAPRPLTIDLLAALVRDDLHAKVMRIFIHTIKDGTYFADVEVKDRDGTVSVRDARPSDALALALRMDAPILVSTRVIHALQPETENAKALLDFLRLETEDGGGADLTEESSQA